MHVKSSLVRRMSALALAPGLLLLGASTAKAAGPVGPGSLPGGVTVVDSDPTGEGWGRAGGRTIDYTVNTPSNFTSLTWGAVGASAATVAFDGTVDAPGETLTLGSVAVGQAVWNGSADLPLSGAPALTLPTRLTLTVVDGSSAPAALVTNPAGNQPGLDVLAAGNSFTATFLFEANHDGSNGVAAGWTPVLDLYDALPTPAGNPPGSTGPVLTGFNDGFFFEAIAGLTLEEHHEQMLSQTEMIKGALAFLTEDAINRLQSLAEDNDGLAAGQNDIHNWVMQNHQEVLAGLEQVLAALPGIQFPADIATSDDVSQVQEELSQILLILFGLSPCPPEAGGCPEGETLHLFATPDDVDMVKAEIEALMAKVMEIHEAIDEFEPPAPTPEIVVQVAELDHGSRHCRWVLTTTVNGVPVDADLVMASAVVVRKSGLAVQYDVMPFTLPRSVGTGMLDVSVYLPRSLRKATVYQFEVSYADGETTAYGTALVQAEKKGGRRGYH